MSSHPAHLSDEALLAECELRRQRRSGPGGQHRNKVETAVFIQHLPTGITAAASERRSQEQNRAMAIQRLRLRLAVEHRREDVGATDDTFPSECWRARLQQGRVVVSPQHRDFATVLADGMDALADHGYAVPAAAERLGCTASQLLKLLRLHPAALTEVNRQRGELGLSGLK